MQDARWLKDQVDACHMNHSTVKGPCSTCPDRQKQLDSLHSSTQSLSQQLQQLQADLRGKDREVQEQQAKLQRFAGLKQVGDSVHLHLLGTLLLPAWPGILSNSKSCPLCLAARLKPVLTAQQLRMADSDGRRSWRPCSTRGATLPALTGKWRHWCMQNRTSMKRQPSSKQ